MVSDELLLEALVNAVYGIQCRGSVASIPRKRLKHRLLFGLLFIKFTL